MATSGCWASVTAHGSSTGDRCVWPNVVEAVGRASHGVPDSRGLTLLPEGRDVVKLRRRRLTATRNTRGLLPRLCVDSPAGCARHLMTRLRTADIQSVEHVSVSARAPPRRRPSVLRHHAEPTRNRFAPRLPTPLNDHPPPRVRDSQWRPEQQVTAEARIASHFPLRTLFH